MVTEHDVSAGSDSTFAKIFQPRHVAVVGASEEPGKVGTTVFRNLREAGFVGSVFPVNAKRATIQGAKAFGSVGELPSDIDLAVICTPAATVPRVVKECGEAGILGILIVSAGFREVGAEGKQLEQEIEHVRRQFPGMRIVGPNCLGLMSPAVGLNASFACTTPKPGSVAFLSQSGALCTAVLDWAVAEGFGFSKFVSLGNMLDVGLADLLNWLADDPDTKSAVLYIESISAGREFLAAAQKFGLKKPIVAYKAGRFAESAQAAASHTGALAGEDAVYEAAFRRAGIVRVYEIAEIFDCAELLAKHPEPSGGRLAILTNAGGPGVMATDTLLARHGQLAKLSPSTIEQLNAALPVCWSHGNPVDVLGDAPPERYAEALKILLTDDQIDAVLAILTPQAMTDPTATAERLIDVANQKSKTVLTSWMGSGSVEQAVRKLNAAGLATFETPEKAIRAFLDLVTFAGRREFFSTSLQQAANESTSESARRVAALVKSNTRTTLSEEDSKEVLACYGIPITRPQLARSADEAVSIAQQIGFPVVMKVASPQISHKTDVGGVILDIVGEAATMASFKKIVDSAKSLRPDATILGVTLQPMKKLKSGVELIVGAKSDAVFGPTILVGSGGITTELIADRSLELAPLDSKLAKKMLTSLRTWPLLNGYRGRPVADVERLTEILVNVSHLVVQHPQIVELDINPLVVGGAEIIALDARVVVAP